MQVWTLTDQMICQGTPGFPEHLSAVWRLNPAAADITCVQMEGLYQSYFWGRNGDFW